MASPGDSFRSVWTAQFANDLAALLGRGANKMTASGRSFISGGKGGTQIVTQDPRSPVSTIQGILVGGDPPPVSDGTVIIDPFAWAAYSIQAGAFILATGTCTLDWFVNGVPISWLAGLAIDTAGELFQIPYPAIDTTNILPIGAQLSVTISASSSDAAGLLFSLNTPF